MLSRQFLEDFFTGIMIVYLIKFIFMLYYINNFMKSNYRVGIAYHTTWWWNLFITSMAILI